MEASEPQTNTDGHRCSDRTKDPEGCNPEEPRMDANPHELNGSFFAVFAISVLKKILQAPEQLRFIAMLQLMLCPRRPKGTRCVHPSAVLQGQPLTQPAG